MVATVVMFVLQTPGCTNGSIARGPTLADSAELAVREARRSEFLSEQQAETDSALRSRPFRAELVVERPTLVAFFPPAEMVSDSVALKQRFSMYQEVAQSFGWQFERRYSEELRITDRRSNALYSAPLPRDSTGVILLAPSARPQVWFGKLSRSRLHAGLRAFLSMHRSKGGATPTSL
jgi:hypothetical protein